MDNSDILLQKLRDAGYDAARYDAAEDVVYFEHEGKSCRFINDGKITMMTELRANEIVGYATYYLHKGDK